MKLFYDPFVPKCGKLATFGSENLNPPLGFCFVHLITEIIFNSSVGGILGIMDDFHYTSNFHTQRIRPKIFSLSNYSQLQPYNA